MLLYIYIYSQQFIIKQKKKKLFSRSLHFLFGRCIGIVLVISKYRFEKEWCRCIPSSQGLKQGGREEVRASVVFCMGTSNGFPPVGMHCWSAGWKHFFLILTEETCDPWAVMDRCNHIISYIFVLNICAMAPVCSNLPPDPVV